MGTRIRYRSVRSRCVAAAARRRSPSATEPTPAWDSRLPKRPFREAKTSPPRSDTVLVSASSRQIPVVLTGFTAFLSLYSPQPLLPLFQRIFGATHFAVSLTVTATTMAVAVAAPFVGGIADVWGKRRVIVLSAFVLAAATLLAATA